MNVVGDATRQTRISGGDQKNDRQASIDCFPICMLLLCNKSMYFTVNAKVYTFEYVATTLDAFAL